MKRVAILSLALLLSACAAEPACFVTDDTGVIATDDVGNPVTCEPPRR